MSLLKRTIIEYKSNGAISLSTKGIRELLIPIFGQSRSDRVYYGMNRVIRDGEFRPIPFKLEPPNTKLITIDTDNGHTFFGYYDKTPFDRSNERVLFLKTPQNLETARPDIPAQTGIFNLDTGERRFFGQTRTWNWQQGCRLQWHPSKPNHVIYNRLVDDTYGAVIQNVETCEIVREFTHPIYDVCPSGKQAVSLNFSRLERLRPDYGYRNAPDETRNQSAPVDDGIYVLDLESGEHSLLVSIRDIAAVGGPVPLDGPHHYVNHLLISPSGTHVSFLHRYHDDGTRYSRLLVAPIAENQESRVLQSTGEASHQIWNGPNTLLSTVNQEDGQECEYRLYDIDHGSEQVLPDTLDTDGHPSFNPSNSTKLVVDTYPDSRGYRNLCVYDVETDQLSRVGKFYGPNINDIKCDLHPRWDREGQYLCFDSVHEGQRCMYVLPADNELIKRGATLRSLSTRN